MSLNSKDPGISKFAIPRIDEIINILVNSSFNSDLIFHGGDLSPATLFDAYRSGLFPMPLDDGKLGWFCPQRRGILQILPQIDGEFPFRVSRSLRNSIGKFTYSVDLAFREVIANCADPQRPGTWITEEIKDAYTRLHELGWAHSFEVWTGDGENKDLVGGLYGVAIGGLFAGESMFHKQTDASKAALFVLVSKMADQGGALIDLQWLTDHLASLGGKEITGIEYLQMLEDVISLPLPRIFKESYSGPVEIKLP
ncbi:MAG: leucyl/phenylalanyl-tRNA--protein transferase [Acidimicrobiaceae bacterium]|nr:leucyl/phenylalanyl-tRNA--protein transferase [Acidimicrobiaceae bacterium]